MSAINTIQLANGDEYDINDVRITSVPVPISEGGTAGTTKEIAKYNLGLGGTTTANFSASGFNGTNQLWGITYTASTTNTTSPSERTSLIIKNNGLTIYSNTNSAAIGAIPFITTGTTDPNTAVATPITGMIYLKKRSS